MLWLHNFIYFTYKKLINSPRLVSLFDNELQKEIDYIVWKNADPIQKYNIYLKRIDEDSPSLTYKIITPGYTGAHDQILFDQQGFKFIQTKIIGKFEVDNSNTNNQNFINEWFTCDLLAIEKATKKQLQSDTISNCLKKI